MKMIYHLKKSIRFYDISQLSLSQSLYLSTKEDVYEYDMMFMGEDVYIADKEGKVVFGGRLGEYKYYDMDQVIASALEAAAKVIG